jgi:DNA-binding MarR family transcriptional regulator
MSINSNPDEVLQLFVVVRRQLNLVATAALRPLDLGPKQATILRELRARESASLAELSKSTHTDPAATGKIIESLIRKEWVKRDEDPADRRRCLVSLTGSGKELAKRLEKVVHGLAEDFSSTLTATERTAMSRSLRSISGHLEQTLASQSEESQS